MCVGIYDDRRRREVLLSTFAHLSDLPIVQTGYEQLSQYTV
jgi:hypothetical protein